MKKTFVIDLFCGAGGTSTAIHESNTNIEVVACINHDANAIRSHKENYPDCIHFTEDIRTVAMKPLIELVRKLRRDNPGCKIAVWASLECTNYSKAKGGLPRDADSRSLADHLFRYIIALKPDFLWIENVVEFMSWGPLDQNGKPESRTAGKDYLRWIEKVKSFGFAYDYNVLNSANYGGFTTRKRFFAQFAQDESLIAWPEATHAREAETGTNLFDNVLLKKWRAVREVLDLTDEGISIFERKKCLSENTLKRIYAGLKKFVAKGDDSFLKNFYTNGSVISLTEPCGTLKTKDSHAVIKSIFLSSYYGNSTLVSENSPCGTLTTKDRYAKIEAQFIDNQYGHGQCTSIDQPSGTILQNPKQKLVSLKPWLINMNSSTAPAKGLDEPAPTITSTNRTHYLVNPQFQSQGHSIDDPCFTLIARMDKKPPYLVTCHGGNFGIVVYETDSETMIKIKQFMAAYGIMDIKMRMLQIVEMLRIQGFPAQYKLVGTQTEKKKYIGNSVEVTVGKAMFKAIDEKIQSLKKAA